MSKSTFVTLIMELREGNLLQTCHCLMQGWGLIFLFQIKSIPFQNNKLLFCELMQKSECSQTGLHKNNKRCGTKTTHSFLIQLLCVKSSGKKPQHHGTPHKMWRKPAQKWENHLKMQMQHETYKEVIVATTVCIGFRLFLAYCVLNTSINSQIVDFTFFSSRTFNSPCFLGTSVHPYQHLNSYKNRLHFPEWWSHQSKPI